MEHEQTIVLRKDLNMRKGKMVAQGAHSSMRAILQLGRQEGGNFVIPLDERLEPWLLGRFKKICVSVNSEAELLQLHQEAQAAGLITALIQDAGLTEMAPAEPRKPLNAPAASYSDGSTSFWVSASMAGE